MHVSPPLTLVRPLSEAALIHESCAWVAQSAIHRVTCVALISLACVALARVANRGPRRRHL